LDNPEQISRYEDTLKGIALSEDQPHVVMRQFAADALLSCKKAGHSNLTPGDLASVHAVNVSPFGPPRKSARRGGGYYQGRPANAPEPTDAALALSGSSTSYAAPPGTLDIYFIDVEGGQSTLLVTPSGQALLIDTGWPGDGSPGARPGIPSQARDAGRILSAAHDAGIHQIDYLLITHFHTDHDGGVIELSQLIPIRHFIDHGTLPIEAQTDPDIKSAFESYLALRKMAHHIEPKPGDRLPLKDIDAAVVSSAGSTITKPLAGVGEVNRVCGRSALPANDPIENPRSTGVVVAFGKFRFLDVGDLSGPPLFNLACPMDLVGAVDAYLVPPSRWCGCLRSRHLRSVQPPGRSHE